MFGKTGRSACGDVEFWHGQERTGWLMKQGTVLSLTAVTQICCRATCFAKLTACPAYRRVHQDLAPKVFQQAFCSGSAADLQLAVPDMRSPCRWFVLKQGKIFWFKSDIVSPVRTVFCCGHSSSSKGHEKLSA